MNVMQQNKFVAMPVVDGKVLIWPLEMEKVNTGELKDTRRGQNTLKVLYHALQNVVSFP